MDAHAGMSELMGKLRLKLGLIEAFMTDLDMEIVALLVTHRLHPRTDWKLSVLIGKSLETDFDQDRHRIAHPPSRLYAFCSLPAWGAPI